ncbi:MAG: hypothetical protein CAK90_01290 [Spartobacteria bacterium AMD-G4]|nr:MAG: hypothetical protein CAK90_01290 [Spartobacteria bacterium AMD-G4]
MGSQRGDHQGSGLAPIPNAKVFFSDYARRRRFGLNKGKILVFVDHANRAPPIDGRGHGRGGLLFWEKFT